MAHEWYWITQRRLFRLQCLKQLLSVADSLEWLLHTNTHTHTHTHTYTHTASHTHTQHTHCITHTHTHTHTCTHTHYITVPLILALLIAFNSSYHVCCQRCEPGRPSECAADSCIACFGVEADCNFNNATNTLHCQPNISRCSQQLCEECHFCTGTVIRSPSQEWTLTSDCFRLDSPICSDVTDQCIISENITNSVLMANIEGDDDFTASCMCNGENCTQEFVLSYSIIPEQPTPSPSGTPTVTPAVSGRF